MSFRRMRHVKAREFQGCALALDASTPSMYDATSGGSLVAANGGVARWEDISGNARHVTQGTSGARPLRKVASINGMDSVLFDGSDDELSNTSVATADFFTGGTDTALFCVLKQDGTQGENTVLDVGVPTDRLMAHLTYTDRIYFDAGNDTTGRINGFQPTGWDNTLHVFDGIRRSAYVRFFVDNVSLASKSNASGSVTSTTRTMTVGARSGAARHKGNIAEIAVLAATVGESLASRFRHSRMRKWRVNG